MFVIKFVCAILHDTRKQKMPDIDYWIKAAARWQSAYMEMRKERDHLLQLLKLHHDAKKQLSEKV